MAEETGGRPMTPEIEVTAEINALHDAILILEGFMIGFRPVSLHRIAETIRYMEQYGHETMPTRKHATWLRAKATAREGIS